MQIPGAQWPINQEDSGYAACINIVAT